jgi:hypothetical protein
MKKIMFSLLLVIYIISYSQTKGLVIIENSVIFNFKKPVINYLTNDSNQLLFVEMGQSNMLGFSQHNSDSIPFGTGWYYNYQYEKLEYLTEDRGASNGSHASYFARQLYDNSGYIAIMNCMAADGSGITSISRPYNNWGADSNSFRDITVFYTKKAMQLTNIYVPLALWCQGESDAEYMDAHSDYTKEIVKEGMQNIIDWWFTIFPKSFFFIARTGQSGESSSEGYTKMRDIQDEIAKENNRVFMAYDSIVYLTYPAGKIDGIHLNYVGNKRMGVNFADTVMCVLKIKNTD